jgi:transcriptional regulator with XRE-family HTH domain
MPRPLSPLNPDLPPSHRLGAELRAFRIKAGQTQESLGTKAHASTSLIRAIEKGARIGTVEVIALCDDELGARGVLLRFWKVADASRRKAGRLAEHRGGRSAPSHIPVSPLERVLTQVESGLAVRLDRASLEQRGGSMGVSTDRGTWVRERPPSGEVTEPMR